MLPNGPERVYACQTKGMAEYRSGHYKEALRWLTESTSLTAPPQIKVEDLLFIAMTCQGFCDAKQAQAALQSAAHEMETVFPRPGLADYASFPDYIYCEVLRREAELLINGKPSATQSVPSTQPVTFGQPVDAH